jgi:hypothetical protein
MAVAFSNFCLLVLAIKWNPESVIEIWWITIVIELELVLRTFFSHVRVIVVFVDAKRSLGQYDIINGLRQIKSNCSKNLI